MNLYSFSFYYEHIVLVTMAIYVAFFSRWALLLKHIYQYRRSSRPASERISSGTRTSSKTTTRITDNIPPNVYSTPPTARFAYCFNLFLAMWWCFNCYYTLVARFLKYNSCYQLCPPPALKNITSDIMKACVQIVRRLFLGVHPYPDESAHSTTALSVFWSPPGWTGPVNEWGRPVAVEHAPDGTGMDGPASVWWGAGTTSSSISPSGPPSGRRLLGGDDVRIGTVSAWDDPAARNAYVHSTQRYRLLTAEETGLNVAYSAWHWWYCLCMCCWFFAPYAWAWFLVWGRLVWGEGGRWVWSMWRPLFSVDLDAVEFAELQFSRGVGRSVGKAKSSRAAAEVGGNKTKVQ